MERIAGIIAEYNPLHNGHIYHIRESVRRTGAEGIVVLMSGDFVQRGEPAIADKYRRARMALQAGADAVLELPVSCASGSAERFASGAVEILNRLNCVTDLAYGCEETDEALLEKIASSLAEENPAYQQRLKDALRSGSSFAEARCQALEADIPGCSAVLSRPNNILAVEYRKALLRTRSHIQPCGIPRSGSCHSSDQLPAEGFASASAIRREIRLHGISSPSLESQLPSCTRELTDAPVFPEDLTEAFYIALSVLNRDELANIQDLTPDILSRLESCRSGLLPFPELIDSLKTRDLARSRVSRALLHILLRLPAAGKSDPDIPAVRLLGMRTDSPVSRILQDSSGIPIVTKLADAQPDWFADDIRASDIYRTLVLQKTGIRLPDEYRRHPEIIP